MATTRDVWPVCNEAKKTSLAHIQKHVGCKAHTLQGTPPHGRNSFFYTPAHAFGVAERSVTVGLLWERERPQPVSIWPHL